MPPDSAPLRTQPPRSTAAAASVRRFRSEDVDVVMRIAAESPEAAAWSRESYVRLPEQTEALALILEEKTGTGVEIRGFLVGRTVGSQAEVLNLAVAGSTRRRGYASSLLRATLEAFQSAGAESAYLEVRQSNTGAIAFYTHHGFERTGIRPGYYRDPDEPAVIMSRFLEQGKSTG